MSSGMEYPGGLGEYVASTALVLGSMREIDRSNELVHQMPDGSMAANSGLAPKGIVAATVGVGTAKRPHFFEVPVPIRMAIRPGATVALLMAVTWAAVRAEVRAAAPVEFVLIEASVARVLPTALQVPLEMTTASRLDGFSLATLRT